jgi:peroxiredoxin
MKLFRIGWGPALLVIALLSAPAGGESTGAEPAAEARAALKDPTLLLIRDDAIRGELQLSAESVAAIDALLARHNDALLAIRDVGPTGGDDSVKQPLAEIRGELKNLLADEQRLRLQGLVLQAQGYDALSRDDVARQLKLSGEQRSQLADARDDFWKQSAALQQRAEPLPSEELKAVLDRLQTQRHRRTLEALDGRQEQLWSEALGAPFDFAAVRPSPAQAPEFVDVEAWINSSPQTMASLRGQVVVVHFFAFGCINCIHNYPWYRQWQSELAGKGVTIVGIHTPETAAEADVEQLRASLVERDLQFPVAVDKSKKNWAAWHNGIWPSVYLVDKQGRLRYWWYGELDWEGAGGQKIARQRIEQLLAEPAAQGKGTE